MVRRPRLRCVDHRRHHAVKHILFQNLLGSKYTAAAAPAGRMLAGAHPHFHGAAFNALLVGRRRWALVPPQHAQFVPHTHRIEVRNQARYERV